MLLQTLLLLIPLFLTTTHASPSPTPTSCHDLIFTIPLPSFPASNLTNTTIPARTYHIAATYCAPTHPVPHRASTIQLLLHGATFTRSYWSALSPPYQPANYSWTAHFTGRGYHTLAIDRVGAGASTRPPSGLVTAELEVAVTLALVDQLHRGGVALAPPAAGVLPPFRTVLAAGHSYGSLILDLLLYTAPTSPAAPAAILLTGYVHDFALGAANPTSNQQIAPARTVWPGRLAGLDPGYITMADAGTMAASFFGFPGTYDAALPGMVFDTEDAQPEGELVSSAALVDAGWGGEDSAWARPLAVVVGAQDEVFCGGRCEGVVEGTRGRYPGVKGEEWWGWTVPRTGHLVDLHYTAREVFERVDGWLEEMGF